MTEKVLANKDLFFDKPFSKRIKEGWNSFSQGEEKLRKMISDKADPTSITEYCRNLLGCTLSEPCFEVGYNNVQGEKYDLVLSPEKDKFMLFFLDAFKKQAPENVSENWNIILGRPVCGNHILGFHGKSISPSDIFVKIDRKDDSKYCNVVGYSEKLLSVLKNDKNEALWFLDLLLDMTVGEIVNMRYIDTVDMTDKPFKKKDNAINLTELYSVMKDMFGEKEGWDTAESYLDSYVGYQMKPDEDSENFIPRHDIYAGFTSFSPLLFSNDSYFTEKAHSNGAVAGYIFYPLWTFEEDTEKKRSDKILDFRDELEEYINNKTNNSVSCFLGGATGVFFGYLDFISWDLKAVLSAAEEFFAAKDFIPYACFQAFDENSESIALKHQN